MRHIKLLVGFILFAVFIPFYPVWAETHVSQSDSADLPGRSSDLSTSAEKSLIDHEAVIYQIQGSVELMRKGEGAWSAASIGQRIQEGDQKIGRAHV